MARGVDQVELVALRRRARRSAATRSGALMVMPRSRSSVHGVEHLRLHLAVLETAAELDEAVGERRLAAVDVRGGRGGVT